MVGRDQLLYVSWFNILLGSIFIFLCFILIIIHYCTQKQRKIKIEPRIKLNYNIRNKFQDSFGHYADQNMPFKVVPRSKHHLFFFGIWNLFTINTPQAKFEAAKLKNSTLQTK